MESNSHGENVREDDHDHPPREEKKRKYHPRTTSHQLLNEDGSIMCWDKELDPRITRERYKLFVHEDHFTPPPWGRRKKDHGWTFPYLIPIMDGGYGRKMVQYWSEWDEVIDKFEQNMGVEQGEYYDSSEEEKYEDGKVVGPRRNDFCHIGPDKTDLDFEYHFGEDGGEDKRKKSRNYTRPPSFLPETLQPIFYSEALTDLRSAKYQVETLWTNVRNMRFLGW